MKSPEITLKRMGLRLVLASLFFINACAAPTQAETPTYLIQYKIVACQETDIINDMCDGNDKRLPFIFEVYDKDKNPDPNKPTINNGEVYFTNQDYPGGHNIPLDQKSGELCLSKISSVDTFLEQIRLDLIFDTCP